MDPLFLSHVPQRATPLLAARIQTLILSMLTSLSAFLETFFRSLQLSVKSPLFPFYSDNETVTVVLGA